MPPAGDSTSPRRRCATRNPAARAGSAAASQRPQTVGQETAAHRRRLVDRRPSLEPVEADRRGAEQRARRMGQGGEGAGQRRRALLAAVADQRHALRRPAPVGDAGAGEMDHGVERAGPAPATGSRAADPRRRRRRASPARAADEPDDAVPAAGQEVGERGADQPGRAGDADGQPRPIGDAGVRGEIGGQRLVAVAQQRRAGGRRPRGGRRRGRPGPPGRRTRCGPRGSTPPAPSAVHRVDVDPVRERAGDLLVGEAVRRVDVAVLGHPAQAHRPERHRPA